VPFKPGISEGSLMQIANERTDPARIGEPEALKLDVLLLPEDLPAGLRANQMLDQVAFNLEPKGDIRGNAHELF
jgi:hypothetical protein